MESNQLSLLVVCGLFLICFAVFGIIGLIIYGFAIFSKHNLHFLDRLCLDKHVQIFILTMVCLASGYFSYTAVYPTDDFYIKEFKTVTLREYPSSAKIIEKSATYPDFHVDYSSDSVIELSLTDFQKLLYAIQQDKRFIQLPSNNEKVLAVFQRKVPNAEDLFFYITFYKDGKTINIHVDMN